MFLLCGAGFIGFARQFFRSKYREWTPESHKAKNSMPTMGGVFILAIVLFNSLLWSDITNFKVWIILGTVVGFGGIGFFDDWSKVKRHKGISARLKLVLQLIVAFFSMMALLWLTPFSTQLSFPFFKDLQPDLGYLFLPWGIFVLISASNAVNLTDGLDGLAISSLVPNFATFSLICYLAGHSEIAHYLHIPYAASAEIAVIGAILIGTSLGFLWYNTYPAHIFMGDVGSLALGAGLAMMALMAKQEVLLIIAGGLFVLETSSVIIQVLSVRYLGKRMFKMAPIHHHFELLGWPESTITARFGIISLLLCLITLLTLKIR